MSIESRLAKGWSWKGDGWGPVWRRPKPKPTPDSQQSYDIEIPSPAERDEVCERVNTLGDSCDRFNRRCDVCYHTDGQIP